MKYSKSNIRDFTFYLKNRKVFNFCGTFETKNSPIFSLTGADGMQAFFSIENFGKNIPTKHPNLLSALLLSKASINFNIKMWAEGRAEGSLPLFEFSKRKVNEIYPYLNIEIDGDDMETKMKLPNWVIEAVENQKYNYYKC